MIDYNKKIPDIQNEILSFNGLATTATLNTEATKFKNKIPDIANLATKAARNTKTTEVESKIYDINLWLPILLLIQNHRG